MIKKNIIILNKLGLHTRASMQLTNLSSRFESTIQIKYQSKKINAKDIVEVMELIAKKGSCLELIIKGPDEKEALSAITQLIKDHFNEEE